MRSLFLATLVVPDYDAAIGYYCGTLDFDLISDQDLGDGKRWVVVRPDREAGAGLLLAKADGQNQTGSIGNHAGGRVSFFLSTDDFDRDYTLYRSRGVAFKEEPRYEAYGTVAVFRDAFGNLWDLIEHKY